MTTATAGAPRAAVPLHYWIVTVLAALWNGYGAVDYTMSHLRGEAWYRQMGMTDAVIAAMETYPTWMHAVWAVGVWGSVAGTILLLLRRRWAFHAFAVSTLGAIGSLLYTATTPALRDTMGVVMPAVIVAVCLFFVWYSHLMTKRGVLR